MTCKSYTQMPLQLISNLCLKPISNDCIAGVVMSKSGYELGLRAGCGIVYGFRLGNEIAVGITKKEWRGVDRISSKETEFLLS